MIAALPVGRRLAVSIAALVVGVAVIVLVSVPGAMGSYTARVTNSTNAVSTNRYFTCTGAATGTGADAAYPLGPTQSVATLGAADVSGNNRTGTYSYTGITYGVSAPCPRDGYRAITLDGATGGVVGPNGLSTLTSLSTFTEEIWFQTTTGGGKLIGFGNGTTTSTNSTVADRHVYLTAQGAVVFGVAPVTGNVTITSPGTYLDNTWHHVVATLAPTNAVNPGMRLYVDGSLVASNAAVGTASVLYTGYLHIGFDTLTGWAGATANSRFTGSLAWAQYDNGTALTPADVRAHYVAGTQAVPVSTTNLALNRTATQSSLNFGGVPARAVDGNTDNVYNDNSISHTDVQASPWWMVDLGAARSVDRVEIWNRLDCCSDRLTDYWVFTSLTPFNTALSPAAQATAAGVTGYRQTVQAGSPTTVVFGTSARYVMVQLNGTNYLSLAEVQVVGS